MSPMNKLDYIFNPTSDLLSVVCTFIKQSHKTITRLETIGSEPVKDFSYIYIYMYIMFVGFFFWFFLYMFACFCIVIA